MSLIQDITEVDETEGLRATETVEQELRGSSAADRKKKESCCYFSLRGEP